MAGEDEGDSRTGSGGPRRTVDVRAYVYLALMVLIGSGTAPSARYAVRELPLGLVPLIRFGVAGLCLLPFVARRGGHLNLRRLFAQDGWRLALAATFCIPVNQSFFLAATRLTPTSHVALIYASVPMVVLLLAALLGQEKLRPERVVGVAASVMGVALIGLDNLWHGGGATRESWAMVQGDLLLVGAVTSWGAYLTVNKPMLARHGALTVLAGTFLVGAAMEIPIALATMPSWPPLSAASPAAWRGLAFLTLVVTVFALAFQNLALRRLDASQVATFGNAAPVLTVLWGVWLFGESITPALALGGALTLGGIFWTVRARPQPALDKTPTEPAPARAVARSHPAEGRGADALRISFCRVRCADRA
ncbi:MAG: DMT family transporter [Isosphaeraceae bacterium]